MFPNMVNAAIDDLIDAYRGHARGWKLSGAGGGGVPDSRLRSLRAGRHPDPDPPAIRAF